MRIGIDIDEVTADLIGKFLEYYNQKYGRDIYRENVENYNLWENQIFDNLNSKEEAISVVNDFHDSDFFDEMELIEGAKESIKKLNENNEIFFITARIEKFKEKTKRT